MNTNEIIAKLNDRIQILTEMKEYYQNVQTKPVELTKSPFERVDRGEKYYSISSIGTLFPGIDRYSVADDRQYDVANYCTDSKILQQQAYQETLTRLLWRFSMENGGDKIDWDVGEPKYYIYKGHYTKTWKIDLSTKSQHCGVVYFVSKEIAQRAIDEVVEPFIMVHPDFKI